MKLKELEAIVLRSLEENERARSDDFILIGAVWKRQGLDIGRIITGNALLHHADFGLAPPESITRCRRKIQETRPDLVVKKSKEKRKAEQVKYKKYNKE